MYGILFFYSKSNWHGVRSKVNQQTRTTYRDKIMDGNPNFKTQQLYKTDALSRCTKRMTCMKCRWFWWETISLISTLRITTHYWLAWHSNTWSTCVYLSKWLVDIKLKCKRWPELERYQNSTLLNTSLTISVRRKRDNSLMSWQSMCTKNLAMLWFSVNQLRKTLIRTLHCSSSMTIDKITSLSK